jgi:hypothetical protein
MARITLDHLVGRLEAGGRYVCHSQALVGGLVGAKHRCVRHQWKVDSGKEIEVPSNPGRGTYSDSSLLFRAIGCQL